jgi:GNAT superfamily N-acetyltransferase
VDPNLVAQAVLRRAVAGDAAAVADVMIRSRRAALGSIPPAAHSEEEIRDWVRTFVLPEREVWLAAAGDGSILGVLVLDGDWVDQLYVAPAVTGMGLGSRLIEKAKSRRPDGLQLWTFVTNTGARRFYERHGFVVAELTDGSGNEEKAPDVRFVWRGP